MKNQMCSECGGRMMEGECMECGYMKEDMMENQMCSECGGRMMEGECMECGYMKENEYNESEFYENKKLSKGQQYIAKQAKPYNKIGSNDFAKLRAKKSETKEGKKFPDLSGDGKVTRKDILLGRGVKLKESTVYELVLNESTGEKFFFSENDIVNIIENIVLEEKKKKKKTTSTKNVTKDSQSKSKKSNDDYIDDVVKKMKDYLKDASKGEYEMKPKHFPKGNGELAKMSKKAYIPSSAVEEYIDNFTAAALENLDYDDIKPNEKWVEDNIIGSSRTGNNPEWANSVETEVGKKRNQIRKDNLLGKIKKKAYNKAPQPVNDEAGENADKASKILMKLESTQNKKVLSEISQMKDLINYNKKTQ